MDTVDILLPLTPRYHGHGADIACSYFINVVMDTVDNINHVVKDTVIYCPFQFMLSIIVRYCPFQFMLSADT
jgi:hypothetical protein